MRAVVFSGGGMFGAYHVGAWKVLSQHFAPDIVVGVSIGSLNAWMVAGGCSALDLEQHWLAGDDLARPNWRRPRRLSEGLLDPTSGYARMQRMERELPLKLRLGIVARRLPSLRAEVFQGDQITWRHLAASCAIPFVFDSQSLDGHVYVDGGLLDPLPLFAALQMGATEILGINCMTWGGFGADKNARCLKPRRRLGLTPRSVLYWDRDRTRRWIDQGEADANEFLSRRDG